MASRWDVEQAVLQSRLEPTARLIVLVLLTRTSGDTTVIPSEQSPSLTELQSQTGLSRSTLVGWLGALDVAGWVKRVRPPRHHGRDRTQYALAVGDPVAARGGRREGWFDSRTSSITEPVRLSNHSMTESPRFSSSTVELVDESQTYIEIERESSSSEKDKKKTSSSSRRRQAKKPAEEDPELAAAIDRLCTHLADRIEANGSKRPTITKGWRDAARLLMTRDGRTEEQIHRAIDWCQDDAFWRANILSMPTLRKQYDRLRLAAQRGKPHVYRNPADQSVYDAWHRPPANETSYDDWSQTR